MRNKVGGMLTGVCENGTTIASFYTNSGCVIVWKKCLFFVIIRTYCMILSTSYSFVLCFGIVNYAAPLQRSAVESCYKRVVWVSKGRQVRKKGEKEKRVLRNDTLLLQLFVLFV